MKTLVSLSLIALFPISGTPTATAVAPDGSSGVRAGALPCVSADVASGPGTSGFLHEANCDAKTIGFWGNPNGLAIIEAGDFLSVLPSLHLVDEFGNPFATTDIDEFEDWLQGANAVNMAYMLSAQLVAMKFNVLAGFVDTECLIRSNSGEKTVGQLIHQAIGALTKDSFTPADDPYRRRQEELKNELDKANNNLNWT
jgi:hypothetical protein